METQLSAIHRGAIRFSSIRNNNDDNNNNNNDNDDDENYIDRLYNPPPPVIDCAETLQRLEHAANLLHRGQLVAIPTETVYGLAADASNPEAVRAIFTAKQRPSDNPLIVHVSSLAMLSRYSDLPAIYLPLLERFWPGPLTIIVPMTTTDDIDLSPPPPRQTPLSLQQSSNPDRFSNADARMGLAPEVRGASDNKTFAFRMPSNPICRALIHLSDLPLAAPSANLSGRPSPTMASHVLADLRGRIALVLDDCDQPADEGLESTVVNALCHPPAILRPGSITVEQIRSVAGFEETVVDTTSTDHCCTKKPLETPGMKYRHYSPERAEVVLVDERNEKTAILSDIKRIISRHERAEFGLLRLQGLSLNPCLPYSRQSGHRQTYNISLDNSQQTGIQLQPAVDNDNRPVAALLYDVSFATVRDFSRFLFAEFRQMDTRGVHVIYVVAVPESHNGLALMNRLCKAARRRI